MALQILAILILSFQSIARCQDNYAILQLTRSPGVAKKDNSVSSSLEKMIVYVSQRKKNLENVSHGLNQIPENHM